MNTFISGERQYGFVSKFNYVREAGTCGAVSYTHLLGSAPLFQARQELNRLSLAYSHQRLGQDLFQD